MSDNKKSFGHVLVTGGCGFLGHHVVNAILNRYPGTKISVLDIATTRNRNPSPQVTYHNGDFTKVDETKKLFTSLKPLNAVIHTASPHFGMGDKVMYQVNVDGTNVLLDAAKEAGVTAFVYTSSASAIFDWRTPLINADERWPTLAGAEQPEYYTSTKVWAETAVLAANRSNGESKNLFLTTSLRPSGIFGEGDAQMLPALIGAYRTGKTGFQIGENDNLFDFTYVGNVATAHVQALAALLQTADMAPAMPLDSERVDGEAFFITNDSPCYFWDFSRAVWREAGDTRPLGKVWQIPWGLMVFVAMLAEWVYFWLGKGQPTLTRQKIRASVMTRYFNIDKAKKRLGYKPTVSIDEGIRRSVKPVLKRLIEAEEEAKEGKKRQ